MCVLTPSDETLLQLCIRVHLYVRGCLSMATCESVCVCAYSVSCPLRFHTLIASSRNRQQHLSLFSALAVSKRLQPCLVSSLLYIFKQIYWARLWRPLYFIPRLFRKGRAIYGYYIAVVWDYVFSIFVSWLFFFFYYLPLPSEASYPHYLWLLIKILIVLFRQSTNRHPYSLIAYWYWGFCLPVQAFSALWRQ